MHVDYTDRSQSHQVDGLLAGTVPPNASLSRYACRWCNGIRQSQINSPSTWCLMQSPTNFYQCPTCGAEFSRPAFVQCAGANYDPQRKPKALSCMSCGEALNLTALSVIRVELPTLPYVEPAAVPEFLRRS